jgi:hypothetical protein
LPLPPTVVIEPVAGIWLTGSIGGLPAVVVIVVGLAVPVMPEAIARPGIGVAVAHWPLAHGAAADVVRDPQQLLHPTAPKRTSPATPAACRSFFISRSPVSCPAVARSPRVRPRGFRSARSRRV